MEKKENKKSCIKIFTEIRIKNEEKNVYWKKNY